MAALEKFSQTSMVNMLRHIERDIQYPKNADIDFSKSHLNYSLSPDRGMKSYEYLKKRLSELHYIKRADVKLLAGWVVTAPKELEKRYEYKFFKETYNFLIARYGEENCIHCDVHRDESGESHMHFYFIPVVKNKVAPMNPKKAAALKLKNEHPEYTYTQLSEIIGCSRSTLHGWLKEGEVPMLKREKVCANERLNKKELQTFHPDLQRHLTKRGLKVNVNSGITKKQGGNMTVEQLKAQREHLMKHGVNVEGLIRDIDKTIRSMEV